MNILFVADPIESFKIYKDTTFSMMREAQKRGHSVAVCEQQDLLWQRGARVTAHVRDITLTGQAYAWFAVKLLSLYLLEEPLFDERTFFERACHKINEKCS